MTASEDIICNDVMEKYILMKQYIISDKGLLNSKKYDVINGNTPDHICQALAFIKTYKTYMTEIAFEELKTDLTELIDKYLRPLYDDEQVNEFVDLINFYEERKIWLINMKYKGED